MLKRFELFFYQLLNELKSLTIVVELFRMFNGADVQYVIDFRSMSVRGRGITSLLLPLNEYIQLRCFRSLFVLPSENIS